MVFSTFALFIEFTFNERIKTHHRSRFHLPSTPFLPLFLPSDWKRNFVRLMKVGAAILIFSGVFLVTQKRITSSSFSQNFSSIVQKLLLRFTGLLLRFAGTTPAFCRTSPAFCQGFSCIVQKFLLLRFTGVLLWLTEHSLYFAGDILKASFLGKPQKWRTIHL